MSIDPPVSGSALTSRRRARGLERVRHASESDEPIRLIVMADDAGDDDAAAVAGIVEREAAHGVPIVRRVSRRELRRLSGPGPEVTVIALIGADPNAALDEVCERPGPMWLLAGARYPGNAGLATRTAEVSGAAGVCIDADFNREARRACLRASMRSDRLMPVHFIGWREAVAAARRAGRRIVAIEDSGERLPWETDLRAACLLIVGSEDDGVPSELLALADDRVRIPTAGFVSSYNLQAAMALVTAELLRQQLGLRA